MFIKIRRNGWINLSQCGGIDIREKEPKNWQIDFNHRSVFSVGTFRSEREAEEVLDEIWEAYREGKPYFEPDPQKEMNVKLGDKWYAEDIPLYTYFEAIQRLGLEKIEERKLIFKDNRVPKHPIVTKDKNPKIIQTQHGAYYILRLEKASTMKATLEYIAFELGVDIKVTLYQD